MEGDKSVAVVTGAGRGIGAATAMALGRRGYHVIVNYVRDQGAAEGVAAGIAAQGGSASVVRADILDAAAVEAMVNGVLCTYGRIDALVCNANVRQPTRATLDETTWEELIGKVGAELGGAFFITQRVLAAMRERRAGRIVYVSSMSAQWTGKQQISHAVSKAALDSFAQQVAAEAGTYGVSVNTVAAGAVRTEASERFMPAEMGRYLAGSSVVNRMVEPEDVAAVIDLLLDERTAALSGAWLPVDGGFEVIVGGPPRLAS